MPKTAILGGGISGLTCALRLAQQGHTVTLFEGSDLPMEPEAALEGAAP